MNMIAFRNRFVLLVAVVAAAAAAHCEAFVATPTKTTLHHEFVATTTSLDALPPMIIGPMIKKMQKDNAKKNLPMVDRDEATAEAPGLKVGKDVWKWPPVWPYDERFFKPSALAASASSQENLSQMAGMLSGVAQIPTTVSEEEESEKFDPIQYWSQDQGAAPTNLDSEAIEKLRAHYAFYLRDGMSILEFGAAEDSYLPKDIKFSRHVGVGASAVLMESNPALSETLVVDLNKVVKDRDIDNDDLRRLAAEPFDVIIMANTVDYLSFPREVFRTSWYLLKPGGAMIVAFSGKEATKNKFTEAQTKMWRDYNDDQHLWITGSFFQFSAGGGWESLRGFDISPASSKKANANFVENILDRGKANNLYVVQATKGYQDDGINPENVEDSIGSLSWMLPILEQRDKSLLLPRLARTYETTDDSSVKEAIERNIANLPVVYEALIKMDTFAFTFAMQSQLATDLISDPDFTANEEQMLALRQGLGLRNPSEEFWVPIGLNTGNMDTEERISLLAHIVPRFGSGDSAQEEALQAFATGLPPTYAVIRSKCPELAAADVELLGTELLAAEVLTVGRSTRADFAAWLAASTGDELREFLSSRKSIRVEAKQQLTEYKKDKAAENERREEYRKKYEAQITVARAERSLIFNPKTNKMQLLDKK